MNNPLIKPINETKDEDEICEIFSVDAVFVEKVYITCSDTVARITFCEGLPNMPSELRARSAVVLTLANLANLGTIINSVLQQVEATKTQRVVSDNVIPISPLN